MILCRCSETLTNSSYVSLYIYHARQDISEYSPARYVRSLGLGQSRVLAFPPLTSLSRPSSPYQGVCLCIGSLCMFSYRLEVNSRNGSRSRWRVFETRDHTINNPGTDLGLRHYHTHTHDTYTSTPIKLTISVTNGFHREGTKNQGSPNGYHNNLTSNEKYKLFVSRN
jgi:hypothetical protein